MRNRGRERKELRKEDIDVQIRKLNDTKVEIRRLKDREEYSKTSPIRTNWERTFVQVSECTNYRSATEDMFREVINWTSQVFLGNTILL
jgi:hypothetical protein